MGFPAFRKLVGLVIVVFCSIAGINLYREYQTVISLTVPTTSDSLASGKANIKGYISMDIHNLYCFEISREKELIFSDKEGKFLMLTTFSGNISCEKLNINKPLFGTLYYLSKEQVSLLPSIFPDYEKYKDTKLIYFLSTAYGLDNTRLGLIMVGIFFFFGLTFVFGFRKQPQHDYSE
ncbi:MAG: hypothetical protein HUU38_23000 [Anaerolineales bacterium]|nr:hypothetical protein [Anaerolineales bacterium]